MLAPPLLKLSLLGPLEIERGGVPITRFRADGARALLVYLALQQGIPLRRETLVDMFSPDRPEEDARRYFRMLLLHLRRGLQDTDTNPPYIEADRKSVALSEEAHVQVDAAEFDRLLKTVKQHRHRRLAGCHSCLQRLQQATALYRGELMAGYGLENELWEEWLLVKRKHYQQQASEAFALLLGAQIEHEAWQASVTLAQRVLAIEPWHEGAHRALMLAHWRRGDRSLALAQYERCEEILYEELGIDPEEGTLELLAQISRGYWYCND